MLECKYLKDCPFFNDKMELLISVAEIYKKNYCHDDFSKCARHMIIKKLGRQSVPHDMFPYDKHRAKEILKRNL